MISDLRDFIAECEKAGELKRIKTEVDWDLELTHVSKLNEEKKGPALLFENVKGYKTPVFSGAMASTKRLGIALGMPQDLTICQMARQWSNLVNKGLIPPRIVKTGPLMENVIEGDKVDLFSFPVPKFYPLDGGRFIGTAVSVVAKDPDTGWINLGTYRMQIIDKNHAGIQILKGKHDDLIREKYFAMGKPMPCAAIIGQNPLIFLMSSTTISAGVAEYDVAGAIRGEPLDIIESDLTGLAYPSGAEIVLEGEVDSDPAHFGPEGPFGEYTGYYSGRKEEEFPKPYLKVKRILHRNNPILWITSVGKPVTDTHMIGALEISSMLWSDLDAMGVPGIKSVYCPPESTGRLWAIVSVKQMYPGHPMHVATAVAGCSSGHYRLKGIIIVDDDIPADDLSKVIWALGSRYDPERGTQILKRTRGGPLDPAIRIDERTNRGSKIILDACIPYEWASKPIEAKLDEKTVKMVLNRWKEYGID